MINLTRLNGAGSLAHEFFHALDDHLGERFQAALARAGYHSQRGKTYFATELLAQAGIQRALRQMPATAQIDDASPPLPACFDPLLSAVNAMTARDYTQDEAKAVVASRLADVRDQLSDLMYRALRALAPDQSEHTHQRMAKDIAAIAYQRVIQGHASYLPFDAQMAQLVSELQKSQKSLSPELARTLKRIGGALERIRDKISALSRPASLKLTTPTQCLNDAKQLDEPRQRPYWSLGRELAARAFEAYVQDRCTAQGWCDDYLVHSTDAARFEELTPSPYPKGEERMRINTAFDQLVEAISSELAPLPENKAVQSAMPRLKVHVA